MEFCSYTLNSLFLKHNSASYQKLYGNLKYDQMNEFKLFQ